MRRGPVTGGCQWTGRCGRQEVVTHCPSCVCVSPPANPRHPRAAPPAGADPPAPWTWPRLRLWHSLSREQPLPPALLPMAEAFLRRASSFVFQDASGQGVELRATLGVEQGDVLGPLLFAVAFRRPLEELREATARAEERADAAEAELRNASVRAEEDLRAASARAGEHAVLAVAGEVTADDSAARAAARARARPRARPRSPAPP